VPELVTARAGAPRLVGARAGAPDRRPVGARLRARPSEAELSEIYRENVTAVYGFFSYSVGRDAAEDLTAATFERVVRAWGRFDPTRSSPRTWIFAIARNLLIDHLRRRRHGAGPSLDEHPEIMDTLVRADDPLAASLGADAIKSWLAELRPREREVLALQHCVDLSVSEIATLLDLSEANVYQISSRALRRLRSTLGDRSVSGEA
jgi:RNA polymerase sigma-70 factor, ECF subfamily